MGKTFPEDKIERIYIAYFNDTVFIQNYQYQLNGAKVEEQSEVHIHILPRTKLMGERLCYCSTKLAWYLLDNICEFPDYYKVSSSSFQEDKKNLMHYLNKSLGI